MVHHTPVVLNCTLLVKWISGGREGRSGVTRYMGWAHYFGDFGQKEM